MKKFSLLLLAVLCSIVAQAWTVSFTNPNGWAKVNVYTFSPETCGTWPGTAMTQDGDVWTLEGTGAPGKIIFNNGSGSQTANLDFVDGATYDMNGVVGAAMETYKMGFEKPASWSKVCVYTFNPEACGGWPGKELTADADGYYYFVYESSSTPDFGGVIFNNGSGGTKGVDQTNDLKFQDGKVVNVSGTEVGGGGEDPIPPTPGDYKDLYLVGGLNGWAGGAEYQFTREENVYTLVLENGLTGEWKIYDGTWDYSFGAGSVNNPESGVETDAFFGSNANFTSSFAGKTTIVFTFNGTDSSVPSKVVVTAEGVAEPDPVDQWFVSIQGPYNSWQGEGVNPNAEGVAELKGLALDADGFKVKVWNGLADAWYCNGQELALDTPTVVEGNWDTLMTVAGLEVGSLYNVTYNVLTNTITVKKDINSGVEVVVADEAPVYFNLQGVKVANPENGIYVKVVGGKASKVVLK